MENKFSEIGVNDEVLKAITELGFEIPTDVQSESIPKILEKKDLIVMSKTGSGKTAAFGIPILQQMDKSVHEPNALLLAPTRELAVQVEKDIKAMAKYMDVRTTAVYGQHNMDTEIKALNRGVEVVCGTPGRVYDHIKRKNLRTNHIEFLVLDEADRMLDMGFYDQVVQIIKALPKKRVTLLFSATMPPEIKRICKAHMKDPVTIELEAETMTVDTVKQFYYNVKQNEKRYQLVRLLKYHQPESCMVFCNTRDEVDRVQRFLQSNGFWAESLHGANNQSQRMRTIDKFKDAKIQVLVATDVAARGIHVDDLSLVVNYDVPDEKNSYVHRVGRTGRAGNTGLAINIVTSDSLMTLYEIEEHVGLLIEEEELPTDEAIAAVMAEADGKWVHVELPPKPQPLKDRNHNPRQYNKDRSKGGHSSSRSNEHKRSDRSNRPSSSTKSSSASKPNSGTKPSSASKPNSGAKPSSNSKPNSSTNPSSTTKQNSSQRRTDSKPQTTKQHTQKPHSDRPAKPAVKHSTPVTNKPNHHKSSKPKVRTEKKMTKGLGEIEFVVREDNKKQGLLGKVKKVFGGK